MKCVSIWCAFGKPGFNVAMCNKPWEGFRGKWFATQKEAIAHAKVTYPNIKIWKENRAGDYSQVKTE